MATPGQLAFGRDVLFNTKHITDWKLINVQKQAMIKQNSENENKS